MEHRAGMVTSRAKSRAIEAMAARLVARREKREAEQAKRGRVKNGKSEPVEALVNSFTAAHGDYQPATVVDLGNELGGGRQKTYKVTRNRASTIVDRWIAEHAKGYGEPEKRAIEHCRGLWVMAGNQGRLVANLMGTGGGSPGREHGMEQAEALAQLAEYARRVPAMYWLVFENVVRNDMPTGAAGSTLADNPAQQIASARAVVAFVASLIAMWRGY